MATHSYDRVIIGARSEEDRVVIKLDDDTDLHLTADEACELAAHLVEYANTLGKCRCAGIEDLIQVDLCNEYPGVRVICRICGRDIDLTDDPKPSDEDKIRDAMAEAQDHPGRVVTR